MPFFLLLCVPQLAAENSPVIWFWSGAVTYEAAVVKAKLEDPAAHVRLLYWADSESPEYCSVPPARTAQSEESGVVEFRLTGLDPGVRYNYEFEVEGKRTGKGAFQTFLKGPMSFRIALGSCASTGSNHPIWDTIRALEPTLFLHMGDFHYEDISDNSRERFRRAFDRSLTAPRQSALYNAVPVAYIWDDHDFGPDDSDRESPSRPAALRVYQDYVPHYPLSPEPGELKTIHQAFTVGRVRFIMTDLRAERVPVESVDGPEKTMMGLEQKNWFFEELKKAADGYPLVVWVNSVPWITKSEIGSDRGWEPYSVERREIADRIKSLGLVSRFLILSGDGHMVALDDGSNSDYSSSQRPGEKAFPVFHAAPLDRFAREKGGPYSHGTAAKKRWFGMGKIQQFGLMSVDDDGHVLRVSLSGHNSTGELLGRLKLNLTCDGRDCR